MPAPSIGIDFGTTNSSVAITHGDGVVEPGHAPEDLDPQPFSQRTTVAATPTNGALASTRGSDGNNDAGTRILIFVGTGLLFAAIVLILFLVWHKPRARRESLITSSMQLH